MNAFTVSYILFVVIVVFIASCEQNTSFTTNSNGLRILTVTTSDSIIIFDDKLNCIFRGKK